MLVLSRKRNEQIRIGDDIVIAVVDIRGDKVRLGILAPKEVPVHRQEVYDAIKQEQDQRKSESVENPTSPERLKSAAKEMRELREADDRKKEDETS